MFVLQTILSPQSKFYSQLGQECVGAGCSVDLFLFPNSYCDVATLSDICRLTSGNLYKYSYFQVCTSNLTIILLHAAVPFLKWTFKAVVGGQAHG